MHFNHEETHAMFNITHKMVGTKLVIEVDLTKERGASTSGKTIIIGSTEGNAKVPEWTKDEVLFGLNVYKKPKAPSTKK